MSIDEARIECEKGDNECIYSEGPDVFHWLTRTSEGGAGMTTEDCVALDPTIVADVTACSGASLDGNPVSCTGVLVGGLAVCRHVASEVASEVADGQTKPWLIAVPLIPSLIPILVALLLLFYVAALFVGSNLIGTRLF